MPNRKEREEIENLKANLAKEKDEFKNKEKKVKFTVDRQKKQIDELVEKNKALEEEVKFYEQLRLKEQKKVNNFDNKNIVNNIVPSNNNEIDDDDEYNIEDYINHPSNSHMPGTKNSSKKPNNIIATKNPTDQAENKKPSKKSKLQQENQHNLSKNDIFDYSEEIVEEEDESLSDENNYGEDMNYNDIRAGSQNNTSSKQQAGREFKLNLNPDQYHFSANQFYQDYLKLKDKDNLANVIHSEESAEGKITRTYSSGKKEVLFNNGARREIYPNKYTIVHFVNNDVKQTLPSSSVIYYYAEAQTTQITLESEGLNIYRFSNNQVEFHFENGSKEIKFADGTEKYISEEAIEETIFADGTVQRVAKDKTKTIEYPNGSKDTIYTDGRRVRTYPDGRVKQIS